MVDPENQAKVLLKSSKGCIYMAWTDGGGGGGGGGKAKERF